MQCGGVIHTMILHKFVIRLCSITKHISSRQYSTKKNRIPPIENVNTTVILEFYLLLLSNVFVQDIEASLLLVSGSKWQVEHAANIGIQWDPAMKFPTSHPSTLYGSLLSKKGI